MSKIIQNKFKEASDNYASEFKKLKTLVEQVRTNVGMFIGKKHKGGFLNMIREIFQNSGDQLMREDSPCDRIIFSYDERTMTVIVEDNGFGIPFMILPTCFSDQYVSSNYEKVPFKFTSGRHGIGSKVTNMLSKSFKVQSFIDGKAMEIEFEEGKLKHEMHEIPNPDNKQGTIVTFTPSEFMEINGLPAVELLAYIKSLVPQLTLGAKVIFNAICMDGSNISEVIVNEDGILTHLYEVTETPLIKPIYIFDNTDGYHKAEIMITYDLNAAVSPNIIAFANTCPVGPQSTHVVGLIDGIIKFFRKYMNTIYLSGKKNSIQVTANDIKNGLLCAISAYHLNPIFEGQAKDNLANEDMQEYTCNLVMAGLDAWAKTNAKDLQKVCSYLKDMTELRLKTEQGKVKLADKYEASGVTGLPKKFAKATGKEDLEFWIVEGDSVQGQAKVARDAKRQAFFPVRGKIPNALTTERSKFLSNAEVAGIITILGGGYGRNFDASLVKYKRVVFGTDADPDGAHIRTLLLIFFMMYMPQLIVEGRVFKAVPPLFGLQIGTKNGKPVFKYFTDRLEYVAYTQEYFSKQYKITTDKNIVLTENQIVSLLYKNITYVYELETICKRYALDPFLLELVLLNKEQPLQVIKDKVESAFRFVNVEMVNGVLECKGLIDSKYNVLFLNDKLINDCKFILDLIVRENACNLYYKVNDITMSLYGLMKTYEKSCPDKLQRYKGLGEMKTAQLAQSTIHPDMDRILIRYTLDDAKKEIEQIKYVHTNTAELVNQIKVSRHELI